MRHLLDWVRRRAGVVFVGTTFLLIVFVGFLVIQNYRSQRRGQQFALEQFRWDTEERAMALSYYFSERKNDLQNLAESPSLLSFFENRALGMSMQYGLTASLLRVSEDFQRFLTERKVEESPIYTRIVFVSADGEVLGDVPETNQKEPERNWKGILRPEASGVAIIVEHENPLTMMCSIPYLFKDRYAGQIVSWIRPETIGEFIAGDKASLGSRYVVCDEHFLPLHSGNGPKDLLKNLTDPGAMELDVIQRFEGPHINAKADMMALRTQIRNTPLSLVSILPTSELGEGSRLWFLPLGIGILAVLILCGTILAYRINTQRLVLNTRLDEASKAREEIESKNASLNSEISERRKAEEALRALSLDLEQRVARRTAALTNAVEQLKREMEEREQAEKKLKVSERQTRRIIEASPVGIFVHQKGRYAYVNPAFVRTFGYESADEIVGKPVDELIFPEDRDAARQRGVDRLAGKSLPLSYEIRALKKDGKAFPVLLGGAVIDYEGASAILGFLMDVSSERDLRRQLLEAQKMEALGTLAGGIAHDFNNILSAVIGYAELAKMKLPEDSEVMRDLDQVRKAGDRAKNLIRQILTVGRQTEEECGPVEPVHVVKEALKLLRASVPSSINFDTRLDKDAGTILADPTRIHQVLMNLCTNAQHAMKEKGGTLTVRLENVEIHPDDGGAIKIDPGPYVRLTVRDTGCGMDPNTLNRIFDPYFTTKGRGEGTGLGLAVVHGIIETYGGRIMVYSEPEKGTAFHVYFPRIDGASKMANRPEAPSPLPTGTERILFVDDEVPLANLGKRVLENLGYSVTAISSGMEALRLFSEKPGRFDLVITDLTMPEITGDSLAREMIRMRPGMPVIIASGFVDKSVRQKVTSTGAGAFIEKPLTAETLARTIRELLNKGTRY